MVPTFLDVLFVLIILSHYEWGSWTVQKSLSEIHTQALSSLALEELNTSLLDLKSHEMPAITVLLLSIKHSVRYHVYA